MRRDTEQPAWCSVETATEIPAAASVKWSDRRRTVDTRDCRGEEDASTTTAAVCGETDRLAARSVGRSVGCLPACPLARSLARSTARPTGPSTVTVKAVPSSQSVCQSSSQTESLAAETDEHPALVIRSRLFEMFDLPLNWRRASRTPGEGARYSGIS